MEIKMEKTLAVFRKIFEQPYGRVAEWRKIAKGKVIGCLPMYFPDEMVHAAGALPVTLFGSDEPITMADTHLMTNACDQVRSTFDSLLKGKYDFLDGLAALHVCDQVRFFLEVWQLDHPFPFFHQIWRPYKMDSSTRPFLVSELQRLKSDLEIFTGNKITPEALRESIRVYNESRSLMRRLNDLRRRRPGVITAADMVKIITSSMLMPIEEYNTLMKELLFVVEKDANKDDERIRIVVSGHPCAIPNVNLLGLLESLGLVIVGDDFFSGGRHFVTDVILNGDPVESFADYYMNAIPCTTYHFPANWINKGKDYSPYANYVIEMVKKGRAEAVVLLRIMYCDPFDLEFVLLKKKLEEENIPYLALFTEHGLGPVEPIRTRVHAFIETLKTSK
jgi:benzoyl-CoA reductase subunit C